MNTQKCTENENECGTKFRRGGEEMWEKTLKIKEMSWENRNKNV